jgi:hypothetical protein
LFVRDFGALLDRHLLLGVLEAPWVCRTEVDSGPGSDADFLEALQEITFYARSEVSRLTQAGAGNGILCEVQELLRTYRDIIGSITLAEQGERTWPSRINQAQNPSRFLSRFPILLWDLGSQSRRQSQSLGNPSRYPNGPPACFHLAYCFAR